MTRVLSLEKSGYSQLYAALIRNHQWPSQLGHNLHYFTITTEFDHLNIHSYNLYFMYTLPTNFASPQSLLAAHDPHRNHVVLISSTVSSVS
jgi:hypothetical protein